MCIRDSLQAHSSYVVVDPKGGTLDQCGRFLQREKYRVRVFNSIDFSKSMHYNPLAYIKTESDVLKFVTACLLYTSMLMADDKTTKTPEQPVTDSGPGKETPPAPPKEPEKVSVSSEPEKKTEPEVKNPQVSVYNFAEIMKEKKAEERAAAPGVEKPDPAKAEKPEKQPETPKKADERCV